MTIIATHRKTHRQATARAIALLLTGSAAIALASPAAAQSADWLGTVSNDWHNGANWADGAEPVSTDDVMINNDIGSVADLSDGADVTIAGLSVATGTDTVGGTLNIHNGRSLTSHGRLVDGILTDTIGAGAGHNGLVYISDGGDWTSKADRVLVGADGATGMVSVPGDGTLTLGDTYVGVNGGTGKLYVSTSTADIGNGPLGQTSVGIGGIGSIELNRATLNVHGLLTIGGGIAPSGDGPTTVAGTGTMIVGNGSKVNMLAGNGADPEIFIGVGEESSGSLTVTGQGTQWNGDQTLVAVGNFGGEGTLSIDDHAEMTTGLLAVGAGIDAEDHATGTLTITGGSRLTTTTVAAVGVGGSAKGSATVSGAGSAWLIGNGLSIGGYVNEDSLTAGSGELHIADGGRVQSFGDANVGIGAGSSGTVSIDTGGTWQSGNLMVGAFGGTGTISLDHGASFTGGLLYLGNSLLSPNPDMGIGAGGSGSITAKGGSLLTTDGALVGYGAETTGSVTLDGSRWDNGSALLVGVQESTGHLSLTNGSMLETGSQQTASAIGLGGTGDMLVSDSSWQDIGIVEVGANALWSEDGIEGGIVDPSLGGTGALTIEAGGRGRVGDLLIGYGQGTDGSVIVRGANSGLQIDGSLLVGSSDLQYNAGGTGSLLIEDGGTISTNANGGEVLIGTGPGAGDSPASGTVTVTGAGSGWLDHASSIVIGAYGGTGSLFVRDNAIVSLGGFLLLGGVAADETVGHFDLEVSGGARLATGFIADPERDLTLMTNGAALITGAGSSWGGGGLIAGDAADIEVLDGAALATRDNAYGGSAIGVSGTATMRVAGAGSRWSAGGAISIGGVTIPDGTISGIGTLSVEDGAVVASQGLSNIGVGEGSSGTLNVSGSGSQFTISGGALVLGNGGTGSLHIDKGGFVRNAEGIVGNGAVSVDGAGSIWQNDGRIEIGNFGTGLLSITNGGHVESDRAAIGLYPGDIGEAEVRGAGSSWHMTGDTFIGGFPELVQNGGEGHLVIADGGLVETTGAAVIGATPQGRGLVELSGGGRWTIGGPLTIGSEGATGELAIDASIVDAGSVGVANGGTLAINTGGLLSVGGNITQAAGSVYNVVIDQPLDPLDPLIDAAGTATIEDGAVLRGTLGASELPTIGTRYTILSAKGGVTGHYRFDDQMLTAFAGLSDGYTSTSAYVEFNQLRAFAEAGATPNQIATATGADGLAQDNAIKNAILLLPDDAAARNAFDQLSGEIHPASRTAMAEDSRLPRAAILDRLSGDAGSSMWAQVFGNWGDSDGNRNAAQIDRNSKGLLIGADAGLGDTVTLGLAGGYTDTDVDLDARASRGSVQTIHALGYAAAHLGSVTLKAGAGYGWTDIRNHRAVAFPGFSDALAAKYDGTLAQAFGEIAYAVPLSGGKIEPFAGIAAIRAHTDGFTEHGGVAALSAEARSENSLVSTTGLRFETPVAGPVSIRATIGWQHGFGTLDAASRLAFAGGDAFTVLGAAQSRNAGIAKVDANFRLARGISFRLGYEGVLGTGGQDHAVNGGLHVAF